MPSISLPVTKIIHRRPAAQVPATDEIVIALVGNPNAGKTSVFNKLTGLRAKTANFSGTTVEHRRGKAHLAGLDQPATVIDLPGLYSLDAATSEERIARDVIRGERDGIAKPGVVLLILDATNLERNLFLAGQVVEMGVPVVAALNMVDAAEASGLEVDADKLAEELGCPVIPTVARRGDGMVELRNALVKAIEAAAPPAVTETLSACGSCAGCPFGARYDWAEGVGHRVQTSTREFGGNATEKLDKLLTHRIFGVVAFLTVMIAVFWMIFAIAQFPMGWIEWLFESAGGAVASVVPEGDVQSLLVDGVIGGVGGMLVFLPQICILFFFLALLEDSGYMARAALIMDRLMYRVGLPGKAFVPLLSAHACAIPAIMSTRVIDDKRDRLVTILVAPLMTCSARVPVYALVVALLFYGNPIMQALTFAGAYILGVVAALVVAAIFKRTILRGPTRPLVIELPNYRRPSLRNALVLTWDRAKLFVKKAGTIILLISVGLWFLATYPKTTVPDGTDEFVAAEMQFEGSFAGVIGRTIEPVFAPLGFDDKISVGVFSSFAAREVIVATLGVLYGVGDEVDESDPGFLSAIRNATHNDGTPVFTIATCLSLLVFYVLAMQCLPTQAVTKRETGGWKWPAFQLGYMTVLAYTAALVTYQIASAFT